MMLALSLSPTVLGFRCFACG